MTDLEPESLLDSEYDPDPDVNRRSEVGAEATTAALGRIGIAMEVIGAVGAVAWLVLVYLSWDRFSGQSLGPGASGWKTRMTVVLSPTSILLMAALVFAAGAVCRVLADWSALRLHDRYDAEPVVETEEADSQSGTLGR